MAVCSRRMRTGRGASLRHGARPADRRDGCDGRRLHREGRRQGREECRWLRSAQALIGSYGTLGVIVEATVKLRPLAEQEELVSVRFDRLKDAGAAVKAVAASDLIRTPSSFSTAPPPRARLGGGSARLFDGAGRRARRGVRWDPRTGRLAVRRARALDRPTRRPRRAAAGCGGVAAARARRAGGVRGTAAGMTLAVLPTRSRKSWSRVRAWPARAACRAPGRLTRASGSCAPRSGQIRRPGIPGDRRGPAEWREMARAGGGHANLEWAPLAVKSQVPVWMIRAPRADHGAHQGSARSEKTF